MGPPIPQGPFEPFLKRPKSKEKSPKKEQRWEERNTLDKRQALSKLQDAVHAYLNNFWKGKKRWVSKNCLEKGKCKKLRGKLSPLSGMCVMVFWKKF